MAQVIHVKARCDQPHLSVEIRTGDRQGQGPPRSRGKTYRLTLQPRGLDNIPISAKERGGRVDIRAPLMHTPARVVTRFDDRER